MGAGVCMPVRLRSIDRTNETEAVVVVAGYVCLVLSHTPLNACRFYITNFPIYFIRFVYVCVVFCFIIFI